MHRLPAAVAAIVIMSVTACSTPGAPAGPVTPTPPAAAPSELPVGMGSGAGDGAFPRTVGHFGGSTAIEAAPVRVAAISTGQLDGLLTVGVVPVGATTARGADLVPAYVSSAFPDAAADLGAMVNLGTRVEPDIEAVAAAKPDLILTNSTVDEAVRAKFAVIAPTVVTQGTGVNWKQDYLLVADAVGKRQAAERYLAELQRDADALGAKVGPTPTVSLLSGSPERVRVFGVASFAGSILADAQLSRPASQQFAETSQDVSLENLDAAAGDWIFYGLQGSVEELTGSSVWQALPAVSSGQARQVDYDVWYLNAGPAAARIVLTDLSDAVGG